MPRGRATGSNRRAQAEVPLRFEQRLVLHQWLLDLFGMRSFDRLAASLKAPEFEGFDENNISLFHHNLKLLFDRRPELPQDLLPACRRRRTDQTVTVAAILASSISFRTASGSSTYQLDSLHASARPLSRQVQIGRT